uniref:Uncharacterized protein n=1 Tax=Oryza sativa subsp. japonica TaxID=39947 RepID=Q6YTS2_ORYSJ|nr:hypothetical protein [Oryza sativa Japonica Group]
MAGGDVLAGEVQGGAARRLWNHGGLVATELVMAAEGSADAVGEGGSAHRGLRRRGDVGGDGYGPSDGEADSDLTAGVPTRCRPPCAPTRRRPPVALPSAVRPHAPPSPAALPSAASHARLLPRRRRRCSPPWRHRSPAAAPPGKLRLRLSLSCLPHGELRLHLNRPPPAARGAPPPPPPARSASISASRSASVSATRRPPLACSASASAARCPGSSFSAVGAPPRRPVPLRSTERERERGGEEVKRRGEEGDWADK